MLVMQINGDYNTQCVYPEKDIPTYYSTRAGPTLLEALAEGYTPTPVTERQCFAYFNGNSVGTASFLRN